MFKRVLQEIMDRTEGCLGVLIMGLDGIAVEKVWQGEATGKNLDVAVAEYTSLIRNAKQKNSDTGLGELRELTVTSSSHCSSLFIPPRKTDWALDCRFRSRSPKLWVAHFRFRRPLWAGRDSLSLCQLRNNEECRCTM